MQCKGFRRKGKKGGDRTGRGTNIRSLTLGGGETHKKQIGQKNTSEVRGAEIAREASKYPQRKRVPGLAIDLDRRKGI